MEELDKILEEIAQKKMNVPTLKTRNSDRLDFYDCAVWNIKDALRAAFDAGVRAEKNKK